MDNTLRIYENILSLLPNEANPTPLVRLNRLNPFKRLKIYAKLEWYNPFGAVKDRIAANMLEDAEKKGLIDGKKLIEPTSGNTGIAMAAIANIREYGFRTTISSAIPQEKKDILRFLGADVIEVSDSLCPDPTSPEGAIGVAKSMAHNMPGELYMPNQYENKANLEAHYNTTGPEIWRQTQGKVTHFIAGLGTCGTISGTGKFLKEKNPKIKLIGVYPEENHDIPGVRSLKQLKVTTLFMPELYDGMIEITNKESYDMCLRLNREESIIGGPSSGMAVAGALKVLKEEEGLAVVIFPDNIFKYTSFLEKNFPEIVERAQPTKQTISLKVQDPSQKFEIEPEEVKRALDTGRPMVILDVREPWEYEIAHLKDSKLMPLGELKERFKELVPEDEIVVHCHSGGRSMQAVMFLRQQGFKKARNMKGGIDAWSRKIDPSVPTY